MRETTDIKEVARLIEAGDWILIGIAFGKDDSKLFSLGKVDFTRMQYFNNLHNSQCKSSRGSKGNTRCRPASDRSQC